MAAAADPVSGKFGSVRVENARRKKIEDHLFRATLAVRQLNVPRSRAVAHVSAALALLTEPDLEASDE